MRVAITGAASGIGRALALAYAGRGVELALIDRDRDGLAATVRDAGARATAFPVDLADPTAIDALARELGPVDILVSNAGVAVVKPLSETTPDDWRWVFDVNVWAPIRLTRALVPVLPRGGKLAFVASLAGLVGAPGMVAYSTSKFALVGFAESLRAELAASGIAVTVVCPGYVRTGLHRATRYANPAFERMLDAPSGWWGVSPEAAARRIVRAIDRGDPQVVFGVEKLGWYLKRLSPAISFAVARWAAQRKGIV
jgi:short-subunit dehydrogenase